MSFAVIPATNSDKVSGDKFNRGNVQWAKQSRQLVRGHPTAASRETGRPQRRTRAEPIQLRPIEITRIEITRYDRSRYTSVGISDATCPGC